MSKYNCYVCDHEIDMGDPETVRRTTGLSRRPEGKEPEPAMGYDWALLLCASREQPCVNRFIETVLSTRGIPHDRHLAERERAITDRLLGIVETLATNRTVKT
jgi:hypothetical protein